MNSPTHHRNTCERGSALVLTLICVAITAAMIISVLDLLRMDLLVSRTNTRMAEARFMAESGLELAAAAVSANSQHNSYVTYQRAPEIDGQLRLETVIADTEPATEPPNTYQRRVASPVPLHSGWASPDQEGADLNAEGFIAPRSNIDTTGDGAVDWRNLHGDLFRVRWIEVYRHNDRSDPENLIGRYAFWLDDESTKLNFNYSGMPDHYSSSFDPNGRSPLTLRARGYNNWGQYREGVFGESNNAPGKEYDAKLYPLFLELGGVSGLDRRDAYNLIVYRGNSNYDLDHSGSTTFRPFGSILSARRGTIDGNHIGLSGLLRSPGSSYLQFQSGSFSEARQRAQQSALFFTGTVYSSEEERTFATGTKRFDLLEISASRITRMSAAELATLKRKLKDAIAGPYPEFDEKYNLDHFASSIIDGVRHCGDDASDFTGTPYTVSGEETPHYAHRGMPRLNEVSVKGTVSRENGAISLRLDVHAELINLYQHHHNAWGRTVYTHHNELSPDAANRFSIRILPNQSWTAGGENLIPAASGITLRPPPVLSTDYTDHRWFSYRIPQGGVTAQPSREMIAPFDPALSHNLALLEAGFEVEAQDASSLDWRISETLEVQVAYDGLPYQTLSLTLPQPLSGEALPIADGTSDALLYHLVWLPRKEDGVRGDPRLGLFSAYYTNDQLALDALPARLENPYSSPAALNLHDETWAPGLWASDPNSPDLMDEIESFGNGSTSHGGNPGDRGFETPGDFAGTYTNTYLSPGSLGEVPVYAHNASGHLAWSTPRLWGDGRAGMNGTETIPDWFLMDAFHMALLPPNYPDPSRSLDEAHKSYGKVNINNLKTLFQTIDRGSSSDDYQKTTLTITDSLLTQIRTRDFRDYPLSGWQSIDYRERARLGLLEYIEEEIRQRNEADEPFLTPFAFNAFLAGNDSPELLDKFASHNNGQPYAKWQTPSNATERRIESLVRSLNNRVTTRGNQFMIYSLGQSIQVNRDGNPVVTGEVLLQAVYERAPDHDEQTGAIVNGVPMRRLYLREIRY